MGSLVIFLFLVGTVMSQRGVSRSAPDAPPLILKQASEVNTDGSFQYSFETENGIRAAEIGYLKNPGTPDEAQSVEGSYSYIAPDGTPISVTYTADDYGFRALGDHLPLDPVFPALIAKALAYNAAHAEVDGGKDDRTEVKSKPKPQTRRGPFRSPALQAGFASGTDI